MRRSVDLALFIPVAILVVPPIIIFALLIFIVDKFPPFFLQERLGKGGKIFKCCKFQTMRPTKDVSLICDPKHDEIRVTKLGRWLRRHCLDEFPQIFNVLVGHMSFIGPRPLCMEDISLILQGGEESKKEVEKRKKVRPGITGFRQVKIRRSQPYSPSNMAWELQDRSFGEKVIIILKTLGILFVGNHESI